MKEVEIKLFGRPVKLGIKVSSLAGNPLWTKCPRCWKYHRMLKNFDKLCDRCCETLLSLEDDLIDLGEMTLGECKERISKSFRAQEADYEK